MITNQDSRWPGLMADIEHELTYEDVYDASGQPRSGEHAIKQAAFSALALEQDREQAA